MRIDLRSDTLSQPTPEMRRAMAEAVVGDDVYGEDPTVNRLQEEAAALMGKEAALFVPSGSMGNCAALLSHCLPGSEVVCESTSHVVTYELASMCVFGGLLPRAVPGHAGRMDPEDVAACIQPPVYYRSPVGLICLENTHNMAGGALLDLDYLAGLRALAERHGLPIHLDGARLFNAAAALGVEPRRIAAAADSVMFCLSKGLCAPAGSILAGSHAFIEKARVHRKRLGGGLRQAGVLAAPGLLALRTMPPRLVDDHRKIQMIAALLREYDFIRFDPEAARTNILVFEVVHPVRTSADLLGYLAKREVIGSGFGRRIRFVTYQDISFDMIGRCLEIMRDVFRAHF